MTSYKNIFQLSIKQTDRKKAVSKMLYYLLIYRFKIKLLEKKCTTFLVLSRKLQNPKNRFN